MNMTSTITNTRNAVLLATAIMLLTIAESGIALRIPAVGLTLHALLILLLIVLAVVDQSVQGRLATVMIPLPLLRLLSYALPLPRGNIAFTYLLITVALLTAIILCTWRLRLTPAQVGFRFGFDGIGLLAQIGIALSGAGIGFVAGRILNIAPPVTGFEGGSIVVGALVLAFGAVVEEILYRGLIQKVAGEALGGFGLIFALFVYVLLSLSVGTPQLLLLNVVSGAWWTFGMWRTRALWGVTMGHALMIVMFVFLR